MTAKQRQLRATAFHEAGHAVLAWKLGLKFRHATVKPVDGESLGHVLCHRPPSSFRPDVSISDPECLWMQRHIISAFAGQIAETRARGRRPNFGMEGDNKQAVDLASAMCGFGEVLNAYLHYCFLVSRNLVNSLWKQIEAVASALVERETINYLDVIEVIMPGAAALRESLRKSLRASPCDNVEHVMRAWDLGRTPRQLQRCVREVLQEIVPHGAILALINEPRLEVIVRPEADYSVWAYFPVHRRRLIAKKYSPKATTRILLVVSEKHFEEQPLRKSKEELRDHLGHMLLYLRNPKARNECADAGREWTAARLGSQ